MKTRIPVVMLITISLLLTSCSVLTSAGVKVITPSDKVISENRDVSSFSSIEFSTLGKVNIIVGDPESLNISGPDNLVPEIITSVNNGSLVIRLKENLTVTSLSSTNMLTFTIVVKELNSLTLSGVGDVQVEALTTPKMDITMSGAGKLTQNQLTTENLNINVSGLGGVDITGQATQATINISGAGGVNAQDLQIKMANVTLSGLGGANLWVTDQLTGEISSSGNVSYFGNPTTNTKTTGLGTFKSLGNK